MADQKVFISKFSIEKDWRKEASRLATSLKKEFNGKSCDLLVFFVSELYKKFDAAVFAGILKEHLPAQVMMGCNASGVIGDETEVEMEPALSVLAMHLPGVKIFPFFISGADMDSLKTGVDLINLLDIYPTDRPRFLCLADPSSCDMSQLLDVFNEAYKGLPVIGGLASGAVIRTKNWLALNDRIFQEGAVGVAMVGEIQFDILVSQGCRPIGQPYVITKAQDNVLFELAGKPALDVVRELLQGLSPKDKALSEHSLFVGVVMNENQTSFKRGDFLIRNIMGFDPDTGALVIGENLKIGHTLQFQLRDAETSTEDLQHLLEKWKTPSVPAPRGGILVSCCGRGKGLFGETGHDSRMIQSLKGPLPLAGFFANGEIGPVGNKNFVHGYTSSLVILR